MTRLAHEIILDTPNHRILLDGIPFPYTIAESPEVSIIEGIYGMLHLSIPAMNVTLITTEGQYRPVVQATLHDELAWARARADDIVHEGLAPIIEWIGKGMPSGDRS